MRSFRLLCGLCILFVVALVVQTARAQDDPNFEAGMKPYGSYHGGKIDTIDLSNGSLAVDIPLMSYPQRGGKLKLDLALHYENRGGWSDEECYTDESDWSTYCWTYGTTQWMHGFNIIQKGAVYAQTIGSVFDSSYGYDFTSSASVVEADGPVHSLGPISLTNWESADGSGYNVPTAAYTFSSYGETLTSLIGPDGTRYQGYPNGIPGPTRPGDVYLSGLPAVPPTMEDTNGNKITYSDTSGWTDTVGRSIPVPVSTSTSSCPSGPLTPTTAWIWHLPGVTGVNSGDYPILLCSVTTSDGQTQLQSAVLPNGTAWTFQYAATGYADLTQITFPTGGTLSYTWTAGPVYVSTHAVISTRAVASREIVPGLVESGGSRHRAPYATCSC